MQQVYFKRMTKQDITKSVSICTESVESFWGISKDDTLDYTPIKICHERNPNYFPNDITIHKGNQGVKDWRICGPEFKKLYSDENPDVGDLMCVKKIDADKFCLSIIKKGSALYTCIETFLSAKDNYLIISKSELEPTLIVKDSSLRKFILSVVEYFATIDNLDALSPYSEFLRLVKIEKEGEFKLLGMFIEATPKDINERNNESQRWFTQPFTLNGKDVYLSTQWTSNGENPLTLDDFVKMIQCCYGKEYYYQFSDNNEHQLWYNPRGSSASTKIVESKPSTYKGDLAPIILYGPPGTGKTFKMQKDYISEFDEDNRFVTTFHQAFSYEEFVEGLKPVLDDSSEDVKYKIEEGIFYKACEKAAELAGYSSFEKCVKDSLDNRKAKFNEAIKDKNLVLLCIDEINRGNVASIFGDLISLIEPSKRLGAKDEMTAILPYSKKEFGVPANLLIVGTMNTADRSIQLLDSALRRRFKFEEFLPNYSVITSEDARKVLKNINARVRCLLNKDNQIGHSYFINAENSCDILSALLNKVIPLLEEYFYNDIEKVKFVLYDTDSNLFYVEDSEAKKAYEAYMKDYDEERNYYQINYEIASAIKNKDEEECNKFLANLLK